MAYTALQLIAGSYNLAQVVQSGLQTLTDEQANNGLLWLNRILAAKSILGRMIPYYMEYDFPAIPGQETYFIPGLLDAELLTFNIGPVRYSTTLLSRDAYFATGRIDNITSLPFSWHYERNSQIISGSRVIGATIYLYFLPEQNYPIKIWGKFLLQQIPAITTDISLIIDNYYLDYLEFALAEYICAYYAIEMTERSRKLLMEKENAVLDISPPDLSITKISAFGGKNVLNWGDINFGRGWRP